jgi:hypothetical protein
MHPHRLEEELDYESRFDPIRPYLVGMHKEDIQLIAKIFKDEPKSKLLEFLCDMSRDLTLSKPEEVEEERGRARERSESPQSQDGMTVENEEENTGPNMLLIAAFFARLIPM